MTMQQAHIPRVSVLMAVYNGERYLRESIDSILGQTFCDFEFLIINDGSTDSSREIILSYSDSRIRLIENEDNIGLTKSLNRGLSLARGEYIARQDADDISHPTRLEKQVDYLLLHPEVAVLGTEARYINESRQVLRSAGWVRSADEITIRWTCMFESPFIHSSVMMRCKVVRDECGGYNNSYTTSQDHELWTRIVYRHTSSNLLEPLIDFRAHSNSVSANYTTDRMQYVAVTLRQAACYGLGQEPPTGWIDLWIRANNPGLYQEKLDIENLARTIDVMHERFITFNRALEQNTDIIHYKNRMLLRIAYNTVHFNKPASIAIFWRVCRYDLTIVRPFIPNYLLLLVLGKQASKVYRLIKSYWHALNSQ